MATIKIKGKEYPLPDNFTFAEARKIKAETGLTVGGMTRAFAEGDADVTFSLVMVALDRANDLVTDPNSIAFGDVHIDWEEKQDADLPKAQAPGTDDGASDVPPTPEVETN